MTYKILTHPNPQLRVPAQLVDAARFGSAELKAFAEELADMMDLLMETKRLLTRVLKPDGFNIGLNLGRSAGAGIPGHVHVHIVPRWKGDHNFMPVTGGARVLSQSLDVIYRLLSNAHTKRH